MKHLLVFGFCPLPFENTIKNFGPGVRAWQFIKPLLNNNVRVTLIANRIPYVYPDSTPPEVFSKEWGFDFYNMSSPQFQNSQRIQEIHDRFKPDAILVTTIFACLPLDTLAFNCPVWIDLFGHVMAEAQAKAFRYNTDAYLNHFRSHELLALQIGDKFSTVSKAQEFATVGELGLIKRLNTINTGYSFCHSIPCAMESVLFTHDKIVFRGKSIPQHAFVILWSGGFNTWTDVDTLIAGIEIAMSKNPEIYFVSTGGQIDGHDEITYPKFVQKVKTSRFRNRFLLKGWIPKSEVHNYYFEANIGINIDRFMYEGVFGSKNRVLDWMRAGLPSLIGELCELSRELPAMSLAYSFPLGDPNALADKIMELSENPEKVTQTGVRAREYGLNHLSFDVTIQPFQTWLENPQKAPDRRDYVHSDIEINQMSHRELNYVREIEQELQRKNDHISTLEKYVHHIESELLKANPASLQDNVAVIRPQLGASPLPIEDSPFVSIVIVTWNGLADIKDCMESVFSHDYFHWECIVVDNGSSDGTAGFLQKKYPQIILIQNSSNQGFTKAVNQGIREAKGDIVFLLNQDATLLPGLLKELVCCLKDEMVGIAGCKIYNPDGITLQHAGGIFHENGLTDHYGAGEQDTGRFDEDRDVAYVTGAAFAFKKSLVDKIGLFDPRFSPAYFEELDFCIRASRAGYRIRYCHLAKATHHESTSTGKFSQRFYYLYHRNRLKLILKHYSTGYFVSTFLRKETKWIQQHAPKEQFFPLFRAYLSVIHRIMWLLPRSFWRKVF